ncbi:glycosyltransferase family 2 protein [Megalodesulfovibrio gigas]|uniref:Putative family 2 glycosyl transferase n=1 Tax=Megalodesulfovibrio gigas (strain ATCC 19364 / DSM 1382 / NCIMB 9332 / VKM B-1759) TaxID=1121448 RepID=T2GCU5_MEGG1|nr:glycosyltransferase [Megalodesulfovibrio gigas]AGW14103.1 putative family 2 glycosyl transferase [Megalodesulfovibrio gigas DSM 1382 = ATCC 19364]
MAVRVSIVVPVFNHWACTRDCLQSLAMHLRGDWFEVLAVDDGSTDQTPAELPGLGAALFGEAFTLLSQPHNRGFAAAVNRGSRAARGNWLLLLNNDTVWTHDCLSPCLAALDADPALAGVGPTLLYPEGGRLQHLGVAVAHSIKCVHPYHLYPSGHEVAGRSRRLQCITAAAMVVSRRLFLDLDGFFEGYVNGMEDVDFCARVAASGRHFTVLPQARLIHAEHQSAGRFARERENSRLLLDRCGDLLRPDLHRLAGEDGYALRFTPWLDPVLHPGPERERTVTAAWKADPRPGRVEALLEMEPAWEKGYVILAGWLERRGEPAAALAVRTRQGAFLPSLAVLEETQRLARICGDAGRLQAARTRLAAVRQVLADAAGLRAVAVAEHARAHAAGDTLLLEVWDRWMTQFTAR